MNLSENIFEYKNQSVRDVFCAQDGLSVKISIFVEDGILVGVLSDGDIRRFILNGGDLDRPAIEVSTRNPITAKDSSEAAKVQTEHPTLKAIPIVGDNNRLLDVYCNRLPIYRKVSIPIVINAGGKGTRLDPYTRILPKPLIPIGDLPILELIIKEFRKYECYDYSIIVNYKGQMIKAYFSDNSIDYHIKWIDEDNPLGTGGGLSLLKERITGTFIFTSCDTLIQTDYACIIDQHIAKKNDVTIVCAYKNIKIPYGVIKTGNDGTVSSMKEKPELSFLTNTGMYVVEPEVVDEIEYNVPVDFPVILERIINKGMKVGIYPISETEWLDMGQIEELNRMRESLMKE